MRGRIQAVLWSCLVALFWATNRAAYRGWFSGDDLNNIFWTRYSHWWDYVSGLLTPVYFAHHFRPVGHLFFYWMGNAADLDYYWYLSAIHVLHGCNVWLIYRLARSAGSSKPAAMTAAAAFVLPAAALDALWKPMYVFDLLCTAFCLLCVIAYSQRQWLLALLWMWLAYKAKESAVMLPVALAIWEWKWGMKRWKRLAPFFGVSLCFGVQAALTRRPAGSDYAMTFTGGALRTTVEFYCSRLFFFPWSGMATLALPLLLRDRRVLIAVASFWALLTPVLFLPMRLYAAYLYGPLAFLTLAVTPLAEGRRPAALSLAALLWMGMNYWELRQQRPALLEEGRLNCAFYRDAKAYLQGRVQPTFAAVEGYPAKLGPFGAEAAVRLATGIPDLNVALWDRPQALQFPDQARAAVFSWDYARGRLAVSFRQLGDVPPAYISVDDSTPVWCLVEGWHAREGSFRWIEPRATALLTRPAWARSFELKVNVGDELIARNGASMVEVRMNGRQVGVYRFTRPGEQTVRWSLRGTARGLAAMELLATPPIKAGNRVLGIAVMSFGFLK